MEKITSRKANLPEDGSMLFLLDNQCFTRFFDNPSPDVPKIVEYLKDSQVYLYFLDEKPIGYFGVELKSDKEVEIKVLAVHPSAQGKGIGTSMINKIRQLFPNKNFSLYTHPQNNQAIIFYLKNGFDIKEWKENFYQDGQPRLLLQSNYV